MVKHLALALLVSCGGDPNDPKYPTMQCATLHAPPRDLAALVDDDWRESIFADERDAWLSPKCDATRQSLRPLDDRHDLEEATIQKECDEAAHDRACRAGCFGQRKHDALVAAWARAIKGLRAFAPPLDFVRLEKECKARPGEEGHAAYFRCLGLPMPPKSFEVRAQHRYVYTHEGNSTSTRSTGLDFVRVTHREGRREREVVVTECAPSRWDVFYGESP
jgi:hypothetical protein